MRNAGILGASLLVALATACGGGSDNDKDKCGDGHVTGAEECDDGNTIGGDGCSSTCHTETSSGVCGDGVVDVATETCDDHNTVSGDGCDSTCHIEGANPVCGDGVVAATEGCDDHNTAANDGCSATCTVETGYTCTGMPSVCTMGGGGSGTCAMPSTVTLTATGNTLVGHGTGDTTGDANNLPAAACDGDTAGDGPDNIWKFTLTDTRDVLITLDGTTTFDGGIRLMHAPCDTTMEVIDQIGDDGCSDSSDTSSAPDFQEALGYVNLPAGTYYLSVDGFTDQDFGTYAFTVTAQQPGCGDGMQTDIADISIEFCDDGNTASGDGCSSHCTVETGYNCDTSEPSVCKMEGCGDGLIQTGEDCDDNNMANGDGCDSTCHVETGYSCDDSEPSVCVMQGCGNGVVEANEECDDGNMVSGDRCASGCLLESDTMEAAEPNDTVPQALTAGNHIVRGTFGAGDVDLYTFTLTATSKVEIETYNTINGTTTDYGGVGNNLFDCLEDDKDTYVSVFPAGADTTMEAMAIAVDDDDGDLFCSYVGPNDDDGDTTQLAMLAPGTYTIRVTEAPQPLAPIPAGTRYMLDLKITPMQSAAVAPAAGDLKVNEFLAADGGMGTGGVDSNCDGVITSTDDEFVELVNASNKMLDLTGVQIWDANAKQFAFAQQASGSLTLAPGKSVTVWAGGSASTGMPLPMSVPAAGAWCTTTNYFFGGTTTAHTLSLNDAGDTITVKLADGTTVIDTVTYPMATVGTSFNRDPDITGTNFVLHSAVAGHTGNFSPGRKTDGTAF